MEIREERRKYHRNIFNYKVEVHTVDKKTIKCASFDLSEGGVRIVTDTRLNDKLVVVSINRHKFNAKVIYVEKRRSSVMNNVAYYYGLEFVNPISSNYKNDLVDLSQKMAFR